MSSGTPRLRRGAVVGVVVLVASAVGVGAGWALADLDRPHPVGVSTRPLDAADPEVPTELLPDDPRPALATDLPYGASRIYSAGTTWRLDRPAGWERTVVPRGIRWVLPGNPEGTYSVRATPTPGSGTTSQLARSRLEDIYAAQAAGALSDVDVIGLDDTTLTLTFVQEGRLRYQHSQFLPASATSAVSVFEVSSSGRLEDRDGLDTLAEHMLETVRKD